MSTLQYACEQDNIFGNSRLGDREWFGAFVQYQYRHVVFKHSKISPIFSEYWISQAYNHWGSDVLRVSKNEYDGKPLDHFKRAGFLCYWLRRCPPIAEFGTNPDNLIKYMRSGDEISPIEKYHGNNWAAFDIGFRLCRFYEANRADRSRSKSKKLAIMELDLSDKDYLRDVCYILSEKNISPHAIGIIYRSLFINVD